MRQGAIGILFGVLLTFIMAATTSQVNTYTDGNILTASQLNAEFSNIYSTINTLDNANLIAAANILPVKIDATIDGSGLSRSAAGVLSVNVDGATITIVADQLVIDDLPGNAIVNLGVDTAQIAADAVTTAKIATGAVGKTDLAIKTTGITATLGNVALSAATGAGVITFLSGASGDLLNNLVNITTNGSPVMIQIIPGTATINSYIECEEVTTDPCLLELARGGVTIQAIPFFTQAGIYRLPPASFTFFDAVGAGTYEYKIKFSVASAVALRVLNVRLMAHEL